MQIEHSRPVNPQFNKEKTGGASFSHFGTKRCFKCNSAHHLADKCPRGQGRGYTRDTRESNGRAQVNFCTNIRTLPRVECVIDCVADKQKGMASETKENWEFGEFSIFKADSSTKVEEI